MPRETIRVDGMACGGCEQNVEDELGALNGVDRIEADQESDTVELVTEADLPETEVRAAVERAGYKPGV